MSVPPSILRKLLESRFLSFQILLGMNARATIEHEVKKALSAHTVKNVKGLYTQEIQQMDPDKAMQEVMALWKDVKKNGTAQDVLDSFIDDKVKKLKASGAPKGMIDAVLNMVTFYGRHADVVVGSGMNPLKQYKLDIEQIVKQAKEHHTESRVINAVSRNLIKIGERNKITSDILRNYLKYLDKGGSMCVEPVFKEVAGGYNVTTEHKFVPWLSDMSQKDTEEIMNIFAVGEKNGVHPHMQAQMLKEYFEGTNHRMLTAARTESLKIRTDARVATYLKKGIKYVEYVTAHDERVRPDHEERDGKIYRIEDAPYLGEYNCRCILSDADYSVVMEGRPVEGRGEQFINKDQYLQRMGLKEPEIIDRMAAEPKAD